MISVGAPSVGSGKLSRVTRDTCGYARNIDALEGLVKLVSAVIVYFEQTDRISLVVQVERRVRVICNSAMSTTNSEEDKLGDMCYGLGKTIQARPVSSTGATMARWTDGWCRITDFRPLAAPFQRCFIDDPHSPLTSTCSPKAYADTSAEDSRIAQCYVIPPIPYNVNLCRDYMVVQTRSGRCCFRKWVPLAIALISLND